MTLPSVNRRKQWSVVLGAVHTDFCGDFLSFDNTLNKPFTHVKMKGKQRNYYQTEFKPESLWILVLNKC